MALPCLETISSFCLESALKIPLIGESPIARVVLNQLWWTKLNGLRPVNRPNSQSSSVCKDPFISPNYYIISSCSEDFSSKIPLSAHGRSHHQASSDYEPFKFLFPSPTCMVMQQLLFLSIYETIHCYPDLAPCKCMPKILPHVFLHS